MKAHEFDTQFDANEEDIIEALDLSTMRRVNQETTRRVNVDFPAWIVDALDREATRIGVTRQAIIKFWLAERLTQASSPKDQEQLTLTSF